MKLFRKFHNALTWTNEWTNAGQYSEWLLFQPAFIPKDLYSKDLIFQTFPQPKVITLTDNYSERLLFQKAVL